MNIYSPAYQEFIARLRLARKQAGMTQVEVSIKLGKSHSYVSKCELGERRVDFIEALQFAKLYKKPLAFFSRRLPD
ncbi:MAG: helix-turn-helix domain-containing protein [Verrucomicrobia bacterium]|nr:helix-turn-helix domain-containing protein [Verrucomicrobiota bacterium]